MAVRGDKRLGAPEAASNALAPAPGRSLHAARGQRINSGVRHEQSTQGRGKESQDSQSGPRESQDSQSGFRYPN